MGTDTSHRIFRLRSLIAHPRTGDNERDAAQQALDRILANQPPAQVGGRSYGARYQRVGRHSGLAGIAEAIAADIVAARTSTVRVVEPGAVVTGTRLAQAPVELQFTVVASGESGIVVTIDAVPEGWGWSTDYGVRTVSANLQAVADEVAELMNAYNRTGSDIGTRFYGVVRVGSETLAW